MVLQVLVIAGYFAWSILGMILLSVTMGGVSRGLAHGDVGVVLLSVFCAVLIVFEVYLAWMLNGRLGKVSARFASSDEWRRWHLARSQCPFCQYSLRGLRETRCPECGGRWSDGAG